ncbi:MAG: ferrous iron transport protein A [Burkholderiales bacterium]|jgi:ferrous iron transport protein A|nr:MAG: ferrous iron transport protein A [Burkholderiales bacterium]
MKSQRHPHSGQSPATTLDKLPVRAVATIQGIQAGHHDGGALKRRLMELGFVPGERVQVLRRIFFGRGPLAVRVGTSTFAMRKLESSLIEVVLA